MALGMAYIAYYRVSTDEQGRSGLGLAAQREAVRRYLVDAVPLDEFTEIESGKQHANRPQLAAALAACRRRRATLIIATLDRLGRNVHFISGLMETGIPFVAADAPGDSPFILHVRAAMAEEEARKISQRTKAALAQVTRELKEKGHRVSKRSGRVHTRLGNPRWQDSLPRATAARSYDPAPEVLALMHDKRSAGASLRAIAAHMNGIGLTTPAGKSWHPETIRSILNRSAKVEAR